MVYRYVHIRELPRWSRTRLSFGFVNSREAKPPTVIDFVYFCPHLPDDGCSCRKPEIGLGQSAIEEHHLDPSISFMVGDQECDMLFGRNLGCKTIQLQGSADNSAFADYYSETLEGAARWIMAEKDRKGS
mgnify:CR=1 FL=1